MSKTDMSYSTAAGDYIFDMCEKARAFCGLPPVATDHLTFKVPCPSCVVEQNPEGQVCGRSVSSLCDKHLRGTLLLFKRLVDNSEVGTPNDKAIIKELTAEWQTRDAYKLREWISDVMQFGPTPLARISSSLLRL